MNQTYFNKDNIVMHANLFCMNTELNNLDYVLLDKRKRFPTILSIE